MIFRNRPSYDHERQDRNERLVNIGACTALCAFCAYVLFEGYNYYQPSDENKAPVHNPLDVNTAEKEIILEDTAPKPAANIKEGPNALDLLEQQLKQLENQ